MCFRIKISGVNAQFKEMGPINSVLALLLNSELNSGFSLYTFTLYLCTPKIL
jgi:hypothetical protein